MPRRPAITGHDIDPAAAGSGPAAASGGADAPPRRGGRPSREQAEKLRDEILDVATGLFLAEGYGATSIEEVARRAGISKRTFYHRFSDKAALFSAVVHRIIERLRPANREALYTGDTLEDILLHLAQAMLRGALAPEALALYRIIIAEAGRFPELALAVTEQTASRGAVARIAALLQREAASGKITVDDCSFAAAQFLQMVVSLPQRRGLGLGPPMTAAECDAWAEKTVTLFLNGCRPRGASP
jgi:TetR/AcrR family transcriptional regulator, mexJK operon transcriptional repressor